MRTREHECDGSSDTEGGCTHIITVGLERKGRTLNEVYDIGCHVSVKNKSKVEYRVYTRVEVKVTACNAKVARRRH